MVVCGRGGVVVVVAAAAAAAAALAAAHGPICQSFRSSRMRKRTSPHVLIIIHEY